MTATSDLVSQAPTTLEVVGVVIVTALLAAAFVADQTGPHAEISRLRYGVCLALLAASIGIAITEIVLSSITHA